jgi:ATP-dependent Lhr-like helicase
MVACARASIEDPQCLALASTDPANPWGNILPWPEHPEKTHLRRVAGALVFIRDGSLLAWLSRTRQQLTTLNS